MIAFSYETLKPQVEAEEGLAKHRAAMLVRCAPYAQEGAVSRSGHWSGCPYLQLAVHYVGARLSVNPRGLL